MLIMLQVYIIHNIVTYIINRILMTRHVKLYTMRGCNVRRICRTGWRHWLCRRSVATTPRRRQPWKLSINTIYSRRELLQALISRFVVINVITVLCRTGSCVSLRIVDIFLNILSDIFVAIIVIRRWIWCRPLTTNSYLNNADNTKV